MCICQNHWPKVIREPISLVIFAAVQRPTRILVIRFSSIGDIVLTTPVFRYIQEQFEGETEIHFLTKKKFANVMATNPRIHKVHGIEKTVQEVLPELKELDFDYVIDLHKNARSFFVKKGLKKLSFSFRKYNFQKWLLVRTGLNLMPAKHVVERYLETLKAFGVKDDGKGLEYYIPDGEKFDTNSLPETFRKGYIAWVIGGAHEGKKFSPQRIREVLNQFDFPVVLIGGKEDMETSAEIMKSGRAHLTDLCGKLTLHESADCIRQAVLVISGDTGMMHIASAFGKKIISLWGCTVPEFGMYPYRPAPESVIVQPWLLKKRPCSKLGNRCKYGAPGTCIQQIETENIIGAIDRLLTIEKGP
jgi:ADP-heptose:LPS heptosyltransferase